MAPRATNKRPIIIHVITQGERWRLGRHFYRLVSPPFVAAISFQCLLDAGTVPPDLSLPTLLSAAQLWLLP